MIRLLATFISILKYVYTAVPLYYEKGTCFQDTSLPTVSIKSVVIKKVTVCSIHFINDFSTAQKLAKSHCFKTNKISKFLTKLPNMEEKLIVEIASGFITVFSFSMSLHCMVMFSKSDIPAKQLICRRVFKIFYSTLLRWMRLASHREFWGSLSGVMYTSSSFRCCFRNFIVM